jgi:hypothetical protein
VRYVLPQVLAFQEFSMAGDWKSGDGIFGQVNLSSGGGSGAPDGEIKSFPHAVINGLPATDVRLVLDGTRPVHLSYVPTLLPDKYAPSGFDKASGAVRLKGVEIAAFKLHVPTPTAVKPFEIPADSWDKVVGQSTPIINYILVADTAAPAPQADPGYATVVDPTMAASLAAVLAKAGVQAKVAAPANIPIQTPFKDAAAETKPPKVTEADKKFLAAMGFGPDAGKPPEPVLRQLGELPAGEIVRIPIGGEVCEAVVVSSGAVIIRQTKAVGMIVGITVSVGPNRLVEVMSSGTFQWKVGDYVGSVSHQPKSDFGLVKGPPAPAPPTFSHSVSALKGWPRPAQPEPQFASTGTARPKGLDMTVPPDDD